MKIVIAGGSGQVGTVLARHFHEKGDQVTVLSRGLNSMPWNTQQWEGTTLGPWLATLDGSDVLINLAGRSVNCRYNKQNRQAILDSRVRSTEVLPPCTRSPHGRGDRRTGWRGTRGARHLELLNQGGKGLGENVLLDSNARNQAGSPAERDDF